MGLIIKDKIPMFKVGYPTMSDKYNVAGAILAGNSSVRFGDLVKFSDTPGYYEAINTVDNSSQIAGFVVATNVKVPTEYPVSNHPIEVLPGEAFNLSLPGTYLAVKLDSSSQETSIKPNAKVYVEHGTNACSTETTGIELQNVVFTGLYEKHNNDLIAEIYIK